MYSLAMVYIYGGLHVRKMGGIIQVDQRGHVLVLLVDNGEQALTVHKNSTQASSEKEGASVRYLFVSSSLPGGLPGCDLVRYR